MEGDVHVVHKDDERCVKLEGRADALSTHDTQDEAIEIAREAARAAKRELLIHSKAGVICPGTPTATTPATDPADAAESREP